MISFARSLGLAMLASLSVAAIHSSPAKAADTVTIRYLPNRGSLTPYELAQELGYFKESGIELKNVGFATGGPESLFALASGNVEIGAAAPPAVVNSIAGGNDFVAVFSPNGIDDKVKSNFYVLEDSPIKSVADLAGKSIAVNTLGAHLDYTVREALRKQGLPQSAAKLLVVPGPQLEQVLRSKQVDVAAVGNWQMAFNGELVKNGGVRVLFTDQNVLGNLAGGYVVFRRDFLKAKPDAVRAFYKGSVRANDWSLANPDKAREIFAAILERRGENKELAKSWVGFGLQPGEQLADKDVTFWIDVLEREGKIPKGKYTADTILYRPDVAANKGQ